MTTSVNRIANSAGDTVGWCVLNEGKTACLGEFKTIEEACAFELTLTQEIKMTKPTLEEIIDFLDNIEKTVLTFVPIPRTLENLEYYTDAILEIWDEEFEFDRVACREMAMKLVTSK